MGRCISIMLCVKKKKKNHTQLCLVSNPRRKLDEARVKPEVQGLLLTPVKRVEWEYKVGRFTKTVNSAYRKSICSPCLCPSAARFLEPDDLFILSACPLPVHGTLWLREEETFFNDALNNNLRHCENPSVPIVKDTFGQLFEKPVPVLGVIGPLLPSLIPPLLTTTLNTFLNLLQYLLGTKERKQEKFKSRAFYWMGWWRRTKNGGLGVDMMARCR